MSRKGILYTSAANCGCNQKKTIGYTPEAVNSLFDKLSKVVDKKTEEAEAKAPTKVEIIDLKGKLAGDSIGGFPSQCRFVYGEEAVEKIPYTNAGVNGVLVFVDVTKDGHEDIMLYNIVGKTVMNVWMPGQAPEWTRYYTTKEQAGMLKALRDALRFELNN